MLLTYLLGPTDHPSVCWFMVKGWRAALGSRGGLENLGESGGPYAVLLRHRQSFHRFVGRVWGLGGTHFWAIELHAKASMTALVNQEFGQVDPVG